MRQTGALFVDTVPRSLELPCNPRHHCPPLYEHWPKNQPLDPVTHSVYGVAYTHRGEERRGEERRGDERKRVHMKREERGKEDIRVEEKEIKEK